MARRKRGAQALALREGPAATPATAAGVIVPFPQGSKWEVEEGPQFNETLITANAQNLGPVTLPANGYIRYVVIQVTTALAGTGLTATEDFPWNLFELIRLTEPNNAPLGLELSGYQTFVANAYGVYVACPDPRQMPGYVATAAEPSFKLRVPVEIAPNGLGALGNQSAAAALRLFMRLNPGTVPYSAVTTYPKINVRTYVELWGEPPAEDLLERPVQQEPMFEGTSQMWTAQNQELTSVGRNNLRVTQLGAMVRTLAFVCRNNSGVRKNAVFPDPWQIQLDNRTFRVASQYLLKDMMREKVLQLKEADAGVFVIHFSEGEQRYAGANEINSWLATLSATRLELQGNSAEAGKIDILTNFISITAVNPAERTLQVGTGGYHPPYSPTSNVAA